MFLNLLAAAFHPSLKDKKISVGRAAIDAVVGLAVVLPASRCLFLSCGA